VIPNWEENLGILRPTSLKFAYGNPGGSKNSGSSLQFF
jgi:hypothetical protein